jgi:hypothetical protein
MGSNTYEDVGGVAVKLYYRLSDSDSDSDSYSDIPTFFSDSDIPDCFLNGPKPNNALKNPKFLDDINQANDAFKQIMANDALVKFISKNNYSCI